MTFIQSLLFVVLNVSTWQSSSYNELINTIVSPMYPTTTINVINNNTIEYESHAAYVDPANKYYYVTHDITSIPTWIFIMDYKGKLHNELWHRDTHNGVICNKFIDNKILFHVKPAGMFKIDLLFKVMYSVENAEYGTITNVIMDNGYLSSSIKDFKFFMWVFPHPKIKNLVIVVIRGHIKIEYPIRFFLKSIKWHIETALQNFGKRLISII